MMSAMRSVIRRGTRLHKIALTVEAQAMQSTQQAHSMFSIAKTALLKLASIVRQCQPHSPQMLWVYLHGNTRASDMVCRPLQTGTTHHDSCMQEVSVFFQCGQTPLWQWLHTHGGSKRKKYSRPLKSLSLAVQADPAAVLSKCLNTTDITSENLAKQCLETMQQAGSC